MSGRSAARIEMGSGTGVRAAPDTFSFFEVTAPLFLLQLATGIATALAATFALRACGLLTSTTILWSAFAPIVVVFAMLGLRVPLRELIRSLGPRERAAITLAHVAFFLFPLFDPQSRYLPLAFTAVQVPMIFLLMQPEQYTRLQAAQLLSVLGAAITDPRDDLTGSALVVAFLAALVVQTFALRVVTVSETYEVKPRMTLGIIARTLLPAIALIGAAGVLSVATVDGRNWSRPATLQVDLSRRPPPPTGAAGQSTGRQVMRLVAWSAVALLALVAAAYLLDKLREAIDKRRRQRELDLDYTVATFEPTPELERTIRAAPPVGHRRRLIAAYARLLDRIGILSRARGDGETAGEYEHAVTADPGWSPIGRPLAGARAVFEAVRYGAQEPDAAALADFESRIDTLEARLRELPAQPEANATTNASDASRPRRRS